MGGAVLKCGIIFPCFAGFPVQQIVAQVEERNVVEKGEDLWPNCFCSSPRHLGYFDDGLRRLFLPELFQ